MRLPETAAHRTTPRGVIMCVSMSVFMSNARVYLHFLVFIANLHCASVPRTVRQRVTLPLDP